MKYGLMKKLTFLLIEQAYTGEYDEGIGELERDITNVISELGHREYYDIYRDFPEAKKVLMKIENKYGHPYHWLTTPEKFIDWLEELPVIFAENQCERGIARSEAIGDYIYENGYDEYLLGGF